MARTGPTDQDGSLSAPPAAGAPGCPDTAGPRAPTPHRPAGHISPPGAPSPESATPDTSPTDIAAAHSPGPDRPIRRNPRRGARVSPLYQQVYVGLRHALEAGQTDPDRPLPSEPALAERFAVSRTTIRKTLARLEAEGLVRRERGRGTFPVPPAGSAGPDGPASIPGLLETLISVDRSTTAVTLGWEVTPAPDGPVAAAFGPGPCLRIIRLRSHAGRPISFTTLHVPQAHAGRLDPAGAGDTPVVRLLEDAGVVAQHTEQVITAVAATPQVATRLGVPPGAPLISMRRLMLDADRRPVLHQESLYAPDRFEYRMTLTRSALGPVARWTPIA